MPLGSAGPSPTCNEALDRGRDGLVRAMGTIGKPSRPLHEERQAGLSRGNHFFPSETPTDYAEVEISY